MAIWLRQISEILAVSCDSFNEETNIKIGRGKGTHLETIKKPSQLYKQHGIKFKVNIFVDQHNFEKNMNQQIQDIAPFRWKVFQVLTIEGENHSEATLRDVRSSLISEEDFKMFCDAHKQNNCFVPESNDVMRNSCLLLDEYMRFLNNA